VADRSLLAEGPPANSGLPNRLLTAFEVAEFVGCHEETVRRAYLRGLLVSQRFGVSSTRAGASNIRDRVARRPRTNRFSRRRQSSLAGLERVQARDARPIPAGNRRVEWFQLAA
jgi:hypothetical protein